MKTIYSTKHIIYGLFDPNTQELRYIGYTSIPEKRLQEHHNPCKLRKKNHKNCWIKSLISKDQKAEMYILEEYQNAEELPQAEIELIEYYKSIGCNLVNQTNGGDGGSHGPISDETKKKMSESHKGKSLWKNKKHPRLGVSKYNKEQKEEIRKLFLSGLSKRELSRLFNIPRTSLKRFL